MDKLKVLEFFLSAADNGSFAAVAKANGSSPSTISKAIARLEHDIGVQLLYRNTRGLSLTQAGLLYAESARTILEQLSEVETSLKQFNDAPSGHLRINVPVSYGRLYVRPWMKEFLDLYPDIKFDLSYNDQYVDMIEHGVDITIRSGTVQDSNLVARRLSPIDFVTCASPDYISRHISRHCNLVDNVLSSSEYVNRHRWIQFRFAQTGKILPVKYKNAVGVHDVHPEQCLVVDDGEAMAELCADGLGLSQMPHFIARKWIKSGDVCMVAPTVRLDGFGVFAMYPKRKYLPAKVRVFIDFLVKKLAAIEEGPETTWAFDQST